MDGNYSYLSHTALVLLADWSDGSLLPNHDGNFRNVWKLCKLAYRCLEQRINIKRLAKASGKLADDLFLSGALGSFLQQTYVVDRQTCLIRNFRNQLLITLVDRCISFASDRNTSDFLPA